MNRALTVTLAAPADRPIRDPSRIRVDVPSHLAWACAVLLAGASQPLAQTEPEFVRMDLPGDSTYSFGCAWGDYNNDGYPDLAVANGWVNIRLTLDIYRNNRDGTLTRTTTGEVGTVVADQTTWCLVRWADVNNDGHLDLLATESLSDSTPTRDYLYLNNGQGVFSRAQSGDLGRFNSFAGMILPVDYDRDGVLDLLSGHTWTSPAYYSYLFRGRGDGTFSVVQSPMSTARFDANSAVWADYDGDGDPDLFMANLDGRPDYVFRNDAGTFARITGSLLATSAGNTGNPAWGDYDNDGDLDLAITKASGRPLLLRNDGANFSAGPLLPAASGAPVWFDYDNDGWLDLYFAQGQDGALQNVLARNNGDGTFTSVENALTADWGGWTGVACGDLNNDGFMDVFVTSSAGEHALYQNLTNRNHWIKLDLTGTTSNRDALGTKVRVLATIGGKGVWQMREISSGAYFQDDPRPNFGLGDAVTVTTLRIEWPSGSAQEFHNVAADQILAITEPRRPALSVAGFAPAGLEGGLRGDPLQEYQVLVSADLKADWAVLTRITTDATGRAPWSDPASTQGSHRFYRALKTP